MDEVVDKINEDVSSEIDGGILSLFNNMSAELKTMQSDIAHYNNYVVYSTFSVEVKYEIKLPIRFMGQSAPNILTINSRAEVPVDDPTEFVRNTDMVIDLFQGTKIGQKVSDVFGKVNDFLSNFASK